MDEEKRKRLEAAGHLVFDDARDALGWDAEDWRDWAKECEGTLRQRSQELDGIMALTADLVVAVAKSGLVDERTSAAADRLMDAFAAMGRGDMLADRMVGEGDE
jgi:hypothetical protein